jgi:hypothetical protein
MGALLLLAVSLAVGCAASESSQPGPGPDDDGVAPGSPDAGSSSDDPPPPPGPLSFRVMTMNIGTTEGLQHDQPPDDGYSQEMAEEADRYYGNGLSWNPAEDALTKFLAKTKPEIVVFQEGFFDEWCVGIPDNGYDFVCQGYSKDRPLQVERLLGPDYQVACADGQEDNCAGVLSSFATMKGCAPGEPCMGGLEGEGPPDGCSNGARIGRVELELADGRDMTLVNVHGTSGFKLEDMLCRVSQFEQIFEDRGDGQPAANGAVNLVMGDLNTDPFLAGSFEPSASYWKDWVGEAGDSKPFHYLSSSDNDGPATYTGDTRIDHIVSDVLSSAGCFVAGSSSGIDPVIDATYWDHKPVVCDVTLPAP